MEKFQHVPGCSPATAKLIERLKTGKPGDVLTDEQLTAIAGRDVSTGGKGQANLYTAIRNCETNFQVVWKREWKAGAIKCLDAEERVSVTVAYRRKIQRTARRGSRVLATVDVASLPENKRPEVLALSAQLGTLTMFADSGTTKKLAARNVAAAEKPDMAKLLEAFK